MIYSKFDDDFIIVKESSSDNIGLTLICLVVTLLALKIPYMYRIVGNSRFDYGYCVEEIKRKHPTIDVEELTKKLEIKRSNYDRLTR